jgi:hypothetical protein
MLLINATTRRLERFDDERHVPPYAILSHTWDNTEVTLREYQNALGGTRTHDTFLQSSSGLLKIDRTCQQAIADKVSYVWIDACCVDRTSSSELSAAINSMRRWYQQARVCYVYFHDVQAPSASYCKKAGVTEDVSIRQQLASARWFTRGWTLQELLASRYVNFFDKTWRYLGSKESLCPILTDVTGIDEVYLQGGDLNEASVAKRMSWAANRETTKVEDIAYCLMGIFDVNMPLLYGEGAKAFKRLQEKIFEETDDMSLFAWQTAEAKTSTSPQSLHATPSNKGISIFAEHPRDFLTTANLVPFMSTGDSSIMSSGKGLRLELPVLKIKGIGVRGNALRVAVLDCRSRGRLLMRPAIVLQELSPGHYMRHPTAGLVQVSSRGIKVADWQQICVRKTMSFTIPRRSRKHTSASKEVLVKWF